MTDRRHSRRDATGRFTRVRADSEYADDSKFPTVAREGIDVGFQGADPGDLAYGSEPRYAPDADDLGAYNSPLRDRNPTMVHPGDEPYFNGVMRTAVRKLDPSGQGTLTYLVGLRHPAV